jgi:hypothetical protein
LPIVVLVAISPFSMSRARYVFLTLPFWLVLSAVSIVEAFRRLSGQSQVLAWGLLALVVSNALMLDFLYYHYENGNRRDWRGAFDVVRDGRATDDLVYSSDWVAGRYYMDTDVHSIHGVDPDSIAAAERRTWLVLDRDPRRSQSTLYRWIWENSQLVDVLEGYSAGRKMGVRIYHYDPGRQ